MSYSELADHVARNLPVGEPLVVIAESFSGPIALALAVRRPMAALVLCNSFVVAPRWRALQWFIWPVFLELPLPRFLMRRYMLGEAADDALVDDVARVVASVPASVLAARLRCVLNTDEAGSFARCTVPTLYVRGTEDRLVPESASRRMAAVRPMSIAHVPGPHFLLQANKVGAWDAVTLFLKSLPAVYQRLQPTAAGAIMRPPRLKRRPLDAKRDEVRDVELERVLKEIEDHLFPRLHLAIRQRALYYHLFRHTRLVGSESAVFALLPLANVLNISDSTVREDLRDLHAKGCIRIEERSRVGHVVRVLLPEEIDGMVTEAGPAETVDVESLDFFTDRRFVDVLLVRESGRCFYCLRGVRKETCQLDHVMPQVAAGGNSYRNIVVACHECHTQKQGLDAADFVRALYRRGVMSQAELEERLGSIERLKIGNLVPVV